MEWVTVRLLMNSWRGVIGDLARASRAQAERLASEGRAEIVRWMARAA